MTRLSRLRQGIDMQSRLHRAILDVGGYWRPLAGAVRLLEELGELAEALNTDPESVALELADLWIITTCLATQYCVEIRDPRMRLAQGTRPAAYEDLVRIAGGIARAVNYYDGPKVPHADVAWSPLEKTIQKFHMTLCSYSELLDCDLVRAINQKIAGMTEKDAGRFSTHYDPSSAESAASFELIMASSPCPYAESARIWGAPSWSTNKLEQDVVATIPHLFSFARCAEIERLDGFVIKLPDIGGRGLDGLADLLNTVLRGLCAGDPLNNMTFDGKVDAPGWQFGFGGRRLFVSVFSSIYPNEHPRHVGSSSYIFFQPESSFDEHGIGRAYSRSRSKKLAVRAAFADAGCWYPKTLIDARVEADLYILPESPMNPPVAWWRP